jgi:uncharacterized protein (DUF2141 family)
MKTIPLIFGLFLCLNLTSAQSTEGTTVEVTIENVLTDGGSIWAVLHNADTFMKGDGLAAERLEGKKGAVTFSFENVVPGTYAIMVMHDLNDNERMDFEENGMPKESYGLSGNEILNGPPTFENAKFMVADEALHLKIRF